MKIAPAQVDNFLKKVAETEIFGCLVFGPEADLVSYRSEIISKKIIADLSDPFLVVNLSKQRIAADPAILVDEFMAMPMFGDRKLIMVKDVDLATTQALKLLFSNHSLQQQKIGNFLLIQAGDLEKSSALRKLCEDSQKFAAIACYQENTITTKRFIAEELQKRGLKFSTKVLEMLSEQCGTNRQMIISEVDKLDTFLGQEKLVNESVIENLNGAEAEVSMNELVMSFASKNFTQSLLVTEKLFRGGAEIVVMLRFLSGYFQKLYLSKIEIEQDKISVEEVIRRRQIFFKIENQFRKNLQDLEIKFIIQVLDQLEKLEAMVKSGGVQPKFLFLNFIQNFLQEQMDCSN